MVQILEGVPGFGASMGKTFGSGFSKGTSQGLEMAMKMAGEKQKNDLETKKKMEAMFSENKALQDKYGIDLTGVTEPSTRKAIISGEMKKQQQAEEKGIKEKENQEEWQQVFSDLRSNLDYVGGFPGWNAATSLPSTEAAKNRENFDITAFQLERYARAAHTKGTLGNKVYQSLLSKLPSSDISKERNLGRIEAWEKALLKASKKEQEMNKEIKEKTKLTSEIMDSFLDEANNDVKMAKKLAADAGYTW